MAGGVRDDAGNEGEEVADVDVGGVGDVGDLGDVEGFLIGELFGVDAGGGGGDVDLLLNQFFVGEDEAEGLLLGVDVAGDGLVEARFFDADFVGLGLAGDPGAATGVVGGDVKGGLRGLFNGDLSGGHGDAVLIDDGEGNGVWARGRAEGTLSRAGSLRRRGGGAGGGDEHSDNSGGDAVHPTLRAWHENQLRQVSFNSLDAQSAKTITDYSLCHFRFMRRASQSRGRCGS